MNRKHVAGAVIVAAAVAAFFLWPRSADTPRAPPVQQSQPAPKPPPDMPLPSIEDSDTQVRGALSGVSPRLDRYLQEKELLDHWTVVTDNLAEDVSPRKQLEFLAPKDRFRATAKDEIDPRSYARYDSFADLVASVDAKLFAAAYRKLQPLLESAYHRLGYPDRRLDDVTQKALQRLIAAPVVEGPIKLVPKGAVFRYELPELEAQGAVEKHLLRMGPRNTRLIQSKAREISALLGAPSPR